MWQANIRDRQSHCYSVTLELQMTRLMLYPSQKFVSIRPHFLRNRVHSLTDKTNKADASPTIQVLFNQPIFLQYSRLDWIQNRKIMEDVGEEIFINKMSFVSADQWRHSVKECQ